MTRPRHISPDGERYEIIVPGVVGRAVCTALLPLRAATHHMTMVRIRLLTGHELPDVVETLHARRVQVTRVELVE